MNFTCCNDTNLQLNFELCEILQLIAKWLPPDDPHCIFGQLIFRKIIKIVATRGRILRLKCTKLPNSISAGALPQTSLRELTALPKTPSWI